jgi:hypothetical protein
MGIVFGDRMTSDYNRYDQIGADASYAISHVGVPGGTPVDFFPLRQSSTFSNILSLRKT